MIKIQPLRARCHNTDLYSPAVIRQGLVGKVPGDACDGHAKKRTAEHKWPLLQTAYVGTLLLANNQTFQNCKREGVNQVQVGEACVYAHLDIQP